MGVAMSSIGEGRKNPTEAPIRGEELSSADFHGYDRHGPPASALIEEANAVNEATRKTPLMYASLVLAAWRGQEARTLELIAATVQDATEDAEVGAISLAEYARAVLYNGLGRYPAALAAAQRTCEQDDPGLLARALTELVEASARCGNPEAATAAHRRLEETIVEDGTEWALAIRAQSRALVRRAEEAEALYREALERFAGSGHVLHLARAQLLYGEWLRRGGRRVDARERLHAAGGIFGRVGAAGFAERARRELLATGETARNRIVETRDDLTPQEAQIARLAGDGYTNPEIGGRLFISPRTVEWHLHKIFLKLEISSRRQLRGVLPDAVRIARPG
jgi:DNA-binding CsgD family transcriptional regulator